MPPSVLASSRSGVSCLLWRSWTTSCRGGPARGPSPVTGSACPLRERVVPRWCPVDARDRGLARHDDAYSAVEDASRDARLGWCRAPSPGFRRCSPLRRHHRRVSTPGRRDALRPGGATRLACSALVGSHHLDGLLHPTACRRVAACCRPWGSPGCSIPASRARDTSDAFPPVHDPPEPCPSPAAVRASPRLRAPSPFTGHRPKATDRPDLGALLRRRSPWRPPLRCRKVGRSGLSWVSLSWGSSDPRRPRRSGVDPRPCVR